MTVVRIAGLSRAFGAHQVLDGLDLEIGQGEFVALLGRSGTGKSTLLRILAGLDDDHTAGEMSRPDSLAVAFQEPRLFPWLPVWRNVVFNLPVEDPRAVAREALAEVGLAEKEETWPLTLSGGQAQRASLARALARRPELLLLDEPFGALDALTQASMHRLVADLWRRHRPAVLLITHNVDEALTLADRALVLDDGRLVADLRLPAQRPRRLDSPEPRAAREELLTRLGAVAAVA